MKKRIKLAFVLTCSAMLFIGCSPESTFQKGTELEEAGKIDKAAKCYKKAAEQNDADAQLQLGCCYLTGNGVETDKLEATNLWLKAAEQGNSLAQICIGIANSKGIGIPTDIIEASHWFNKAANSEDTSAKIIVGFIYACGEFGPKDKSKAMRLWHSAAKKGDAEAQLLLGLICAVGINGEGEGNIEEAIKWTKKAAGQNYVLAQIFLQFLYLSKFDLTKLDDLKEDKQLEKLMVDTAKLLIKVAAKDNTSARKATVLWQVLMETDEKPMKAAKKLDKFFQ